MKGSFRIMIIVDDERYTPEEVRELLRLAEQQGHPLGLGTYLEEMTLRQLDGLVHGRLDA